MHLLAVVADRLSKRLGTPPDRARLVIHNRRALHGPASIAMQDEAIDATKHQGSIAKIEIGQALHEGIIDGVALKAILKGSAHSGFGMTAQF